jgi:hypothetical protein
MSEQPFAVMFLDMSQGRLSQALGRPISVNAVLLATANDRESAGVTCLALADAAQLVMPGTEVMGATNGARLFTAQQQAVATWFILDVASDGYQLRRGDGQASEEVFPSFDSAQVAASRYMDAVVEDAEGQRATWSQEGGVYIAADGGTVLASVAIEPVAMHRTGETSAATHAGMLTPDDASSHIVMMMEMLSTSVQELAQLVAAVNPNMEVRDLPKLAMAATAIGAANARLSTAKRLLREVPTATDGNT